MNNLEKKESLDNLSAGWDIKNDDILYKAFSFSTFGEAYSFVSAVAELAEQHNHHPDISFGWGYANLSLTTHYKGALTKKDFMLAAAIDKLT